MDLKQNIDDFDLVFLDVETTGLDAAKGEAICEIAALKVKRGEVIDQFQTLVNPKKEMPQEVYRIHKISDEELRGAPFFEDIAEELLSFLGNSVICAYNADFDMSFLNHELMRAKRPLLQAKPLDIMRIAKKTVRIPRYNLITVATYFNIKAEGDLHRALTDANLTFKVFCSLKDILKEKGINSLEDYLSLQNKPNNSQPLIP
ncbi:MAG: 3'-5' exonuclease [Candidatus Omnitrophota bacterium]|nr:MAG: 3'-5' exonuclease [Candidatus Omnitrophota bacterium]